MSKPFIATTISAVLLLFSQAIWSSEHISEREYRIKAAYLYNLIKFIEWPVGTINSNNSIELCSFNDSPLNKEIQSITQRNIRNLTINIRLLDNHESIPDSCYVVFVPSKNNNFKNIVALNNLTESAILTVGEDNNFLKGNGVIALVLEEDHVQLKINLKQAKQRNFKINGKLLEIAEIIE